MSMEGGKKGLVIRILIVVIILAIIGGIYYYDTTLEKGVIKGFITRTENKSENTAPDGNITEEDGEEPEELQNTQENKEPVLENVLALEEDSKSSFVVYGKGFLHCTKDGAKFYSSMDSQKWNSTYNMSAPVVISEGNYTCLLYTSPRRRLLIGR